MKRKILTAISAAAIGACMTIGLAACDFKITFVCDDHAYSEWTTSKEATCTVDGEKTRQCEKCGYVEKETIEATGHKPSDAWSKDENGHWHVCTNAGCDEQSDKASHKDTDNDDKCDECGYTMQTEAPHTHTYGDVTYVWNEENTVCTATRTCADCDTATDGHTQTANATISDTVEQSATCTLPELTKYTATFEEDWAETQTKENVETKAALEHKKGETWQSDTLYHWKKCENAGCSQTFDKALHTYSDDTFACACGYQAQGLVVTYSEDDDGYIVVGYCGDDTEITIPSSYHAGEPYGEKSIVSVANLFALNAASAYKQVTKIVLSEGIKSIGMRAFYKCDQLSSVIIPSTVTEIGNGAFDYCSALTTINLPEGITKIGDGAFSGSGLTEIVIPKTVTYLGRASFLDCNQLEKITVPFIGSDKTYSQAFAYIFSMGSVEECYKYVPQSLKTVIISENVNVGGIAFMNCAGIQNISFTKGVSGIGEQAFAGCSGLTEIDLSSSTLTEISANAFKGCTLLSKVTLPNGLTTIESAAFEGCANLTNVNLPESLETIELSAFANCTSLEEIKLPNGLTTIGSAAFAGCSGLTKIDLSSCGLTEIEVSVFKMCSSLTEVKLPSGLRSIKDMAFINCSRLKTIDLPVDLSEIGISAFDNCAFTHIEFPKSLTKIGNGAFDNCRSLTEIVIPDSVTDIGSHVFGGCEKVTKITLPWRVDYIGYIFGAAAYNANGSYTKKLSEVVITTGENISQGAFFGCSSLTSITLPSNLKSVGEEAFGRCTALKTVRFAGTMGEWCGISFGDNTNKTNDSTCPLYFSKSLYLKDDNGEYQKVTHAVIPEGVTAIGLNFCFNEAITSITIPASVKNVAINAFYGCGNLVNVYYDGSIEDYCGIEYAVDSYGASQYGNPMYNSDKTKTFYLKNASGSYQKITSLTIPETVNRIGNCQFAAFKQIESVTISSSVTSIGSWAFSMCGGLKEIKISDSVVTIENYAFSYCSYLESVEISASVKSIGENAFRNCSKLKTIRFNGTQAEWEAIEKGSKNGEEWNYGTSSSLEIVYTDGKISISK